MNSHRKAKAAKKTTNLLARTREFKKERISISPEPDEKETPNGKMLLF